MGNFSYILNTNNEVYKLRDSLVVSANNTVNPTTLAASNVSVLPLSLPWRSSELAVGDRTVEIDFGTNVTADFVAVCGHNISSGATQFRMFSGASSPAVDEIFNLLPNHLGPGSTWAYRSAGTVSRRYWRLVMTDSSATNLDGYEEVGYIVIGQLQELGFNMNVDWIEEQSLSNRQAESVAGSPLVGELVDRRSRVALTFGNLLKAERDTFKQWLRAFDGSRIPAFIVPDPDDNFGFFGRLQTPLVVPYVHRNKGVMDETLLSFIEDNPGIKISA